MTAIDDIAAERSRQIEAECWTPEHDDAHSAMEMSKAAQCYVKSAINSQLVTSTPYNSWLASDEQLELAYPKGRPPRGWPWSVDWWKPKDTRRDLVRAAALIAAEIERLDRAATTKEPTNAG